MSKPFKDSTNTSTSFWHSWRPEKVIISGVGTEADVVDNQDHIPGQYESNLMDIFSLTRDPINWYRVSVAPSLFFSLKLYPPTKDGWGIISSAIIDAFLKQGDTQLIRARTPCNRPPNKSTGELYYILSCTRWLTQSNTKPMEERFEVESVVLPHGQKITYKSNVRMDPMVNKPSGNRKSKVKHGAKSLPRRNNTSKNTNTHEKCNFTIPMYLKEGQ